MAVIARAPERGALVIVRPRDLEPLLHGRSARRWTAVELEVRELDRRESEKWGARLTRHLRACGCDEGAAAVVLGLGGLTASRRRRSKAPASAGREVAAGFVVAAASAAVGKGIGIGLARRRLRADARRLAAVLAQRASASAPPAPGKPAQLAVGTNAL